MESQTPVVQKNPNPQGKGCVALLQDWALMRPQLPARKASGDIFRDYCWSALVLAAQFGFRPVRGRRYYLYCDKVHWKLSLIAPQEWGASMPGEFVADCRLRDDMTWQLEFTRLPRHSEARQRLEDFAEGFTRAISSQDSIVDELPFYQGHLPYLQRMLAAGLARSLQHSIQEVGSSARLRQPPGLLPGPL